MITVLVTSSNVYINLINLDYLYDRYILST